MMQRLRTLRFVTLCDASRARAQPRGARAGRAFSAMPRSECVSPFGPEDERSCRRTTRARVVRGESTRGGAAGRRSGASRALSVRLVDGDFIMVDMPQTGCPKSNASVKIEFNVIMGTNGSSKV